MKRILLLTVMLCMAVVGVYATNPAIESPGIDYDSVFVSLGALATGVVFLIEGIKQLFPLMQGIATQLVSWGTGIALALFGWWFGLGFLADITWYIAILYGFAASLIANGIADTGFMEWLLNLFRNKK